MRPQTSVFSLICTAWVALTGKGQQAQMSGREMTFRMPPVL